jgi:hypothetical protein
VSPHGAATRQATRSASPHGAATRRATRAGQRSVVGGLP